MNKKIVFLFIFVMIFFGKISHAKYIMEQTILVARINIDTNPPKIELMNIKSIPNKDKIYNINVQVKVVENNIKENNFNKDKIKIYIDEEIIDKELYEINKLQEIDNYIIYEIRINKIMLEEKLKIIIPEGIIQDYSDNKSEEKIIQNNF